MIEEGPRTAKHGNLLLGIVVVTALAAILWTAAALIYLVATGRA